MIDTPKYMSCISSTFNSFRPEVRAVRTAQRQRGPLGHYYYSKLFSLEILVVILLPPFVNKLSLTLVFSVCHVRVPIQHNM